MNVRTRINLIWYFFTNFRKYELISFIVSILAASMGVFSLIWKNEIIMYVVVATVVADIMIKLVSAWKFVDPKDSLKEIEKSQSLSYINSKNEHQELNDISSLRPSVEESDNGFESKIFDKNNVVFLSNRIDVFLIYNPYLRINLIDRYEENILDKSESHWNDQKEYISVFAVKNKGVLFNEKKLSLDCNLSDEMESVSVGKTSYFTSVITNEACTKIIKKHKQSVKDFRSIFPWSFDDSGIMQSISVSNMSNHIGVSTLAITADHYAVPWMQNGKAQQSVTKIAPTGSGSLDWNDYLRTKNKNSFLQTIKYGMARELVEEANLKKKTTISRVADETIVIGFFRWVSRGGKPEFIGITRTEYNQSQFTPQYSEVDAVDQHGRHVSKPNFSKVSYIIDYCNNQLSKGYKLTDNSVPYLAILYRLKSIFTGELGVETKKLLVDFLRIHDDV